MDYMNKSIFINYWDAGFGRNMCCRKIDIFLA